MPNEGRYISAAQAVLARLNRPMHYEQITAVALKLGLLDSTGEKPEIAMSSILSGDIRTNSSSVFAKERRGVYKLVRRGPFRDEAIGSHQQTTGALVMLIQSKSGIDSERKIAKRALYLAGRTLDMAGHTDVAWFGDTQRKQSIEINLAELLGLVEIPALATRLTRSHTGSGVPAGQFGSIAQPIGQYQRLADRLCAEPRAAIHFSLCLFDLALDTVGPDGLVRVYSSEGVSLQLAIKSTGRRPDAA